MFNKLFENITNMNPKSLLFWSEAERYVKEHSTIVYFFGCGTSTVWKDKLYNHNNKSAETDFQFSYKKTQCR